MDISFHAIKEKNHSISEITSPFYYLSRNLHLIIKNNQADLYYQVCECSYLVYVKLTTRLISFFKILMTFRQLCFSYAVGIICSYYFYRPLLALDVVCHEPKDQVIEYSRVGIFVHR